MKQTEGETEKGNLKKKHDAAPPPPPPPPPPSPLPKFRVIKKSASISVTNREIAMFWRRKRMEEEDHLLAAIKAAARIRARKLTEDDYRHFEESLKEDYKENSPATAAAAATTGKEVKQIRELRVGIKDWWTKSKYAYLNQPAVGSVDTPKHRASTYIPNLCNYKPAPPPTPLFGVY
ncbi:hypothetical protein NMG60_11007798 [Bertholletia excelsa]